MLHCDFLTSHTCLLTLFAKIKCSQKYLNLQFAYGFYIYYIHTKKTGKLRPKTDKRLDESTLQHVKGYSQLFINKIFTVRVIDSCFIQLS